LGFSWGWKLNFKRNGNAQIKSIAVSKVVELLYVRKQVATIYIEKEEEIMFDRNIRERLRVLGVNELGIMHQIVQIKGL